MHHRTRGFRRAILALLLISGSAATVGNASRAQVAAPSGLRQSAARPIGDSLVVFELTQVDKLGTGGTTNDQLTVIFSNRGVETATPPVPIFGDDILGEFSFSGRDFVKNQLRVSRRVKDKSFLSARYIRVINHGSDGWNGGTISLTVDDEPILRRVEMRPRRVGPRASSKDGGIEFFNAADWQKRSYWELDLQRHRGATRK